MQYASRQGATAAANLKNTLELKLIRGCRLSYCKQHQCLKANAKNLRYTFRPSGSSGAFKVWLSTRFIFMV